MKYYVFMLAALAGAQSVTTNYTTDLNGNRVADGSRVSSDSTTTLTTQSINGTRVPMEQTEVRVLSKSATGQVTETIHKRFDQNGNLVETDRVVTDQQKQPSGETLHVTTYRSDINGAMQEAERKTVASTTKGSVTDTRTTVARPTMNGFETVEKSSQVTETSDGRTHSDQTIYRRSDNGTFDPQFRTVTDTTQSDGKTVEKTQQYEPVGSVSQMQLTRQTVETTTTHPDGSSVSRLDYYGSSVPGLVSEPGTPQQLYEQDTIVRTPGAGGSVTETLTARRASLSNPKQLGPPVPVSETVCTGNCAPSAHP